MQSISSETISLTQRLCICLRSDDEFCPFLNLIGLFGRSDIGVGGGVPNIELFLTESTLSTLTKHSQRRAEGVVVPQTLRSENTVLL